MAEPNADPTPPSSTRRAVIWAVIVIAAGVVLGTVALVDGPSSKVPRSFYGVVSQSPLSTADVERMRAGRIGSLRMLFDWATIDPSSEPDDYQWSAIDSVLADAVRNGIEPVPFLYGTPAWVAQGLDGRDCEAPDCGLYAPDSPAALGAWRRFVAAAVARYGPGGEFFEEHPELPAAPVAAWQIWNEQNSESFYRPAPDVRGYAALLGSAATEIHGADPGATVILGGMFGTPFGGQEPSLSAWSYLRRLYDLAGTPEDFEAVAVHPYAAQLPSLTEQVERVRDEMVAADDAESELWVTEIGWASSDGANPLERGPQGQADRLREALDYFLSVREAYRIAEVTWFAWRDLSGRPICEWCAHAGLFEAERLTAKPSWDAYAAYTGGE